MTNFDDVGDFHERFDLPRVHRSPYDPCLRENRGSVCPGPRDLTPELMEFRIKFLLEELEELIEGAGLVRTWTPDGELRLKSTSTPRDDAQVFDALLDLVYVALGTAHLLGYPWQEGWAAVQRANMQKVRAANDGSDSKRGSMWDVVKPKGWKAPDISGVLRKYGFNDKARREPDQ